MRDLLSSQKYACLKLLLPWLLQLALNLVLKQQLQEVLQNGKKKNEEIDP
jgi:hypothetical protein